jgi:hypothetical protein
MENTNFYWGFSNECFETDEDSIGYSIFVWFWGVYYFLGGEMDGIIMIWMG